ncbi:UNVERIFIED_CONTAM: LuxR family transcriptional regulator [Aeromonas hydrophila]
MTNNHTVNVTDALTIITCLNNTSDESTILSLLRKLCQLMGFEYFRLAFIFPSSIQRPRVRILNGCPTDWVKKYNECHFFAADPVVRKGMAQSTPIMWNALIMECSDRKDVEGLEVMQLAQEFGLSDGITFPWHGAHGHVGLLSFITSKPRNEYQWLTALPFLSWLSAHIFEAVARAGFAEMPSHDALSLRELEVCQWAAEGKQVSDIAKILDITPRTVTFHLSRVAEKLGASSKSQAISWAIKQGLVRLNIDRAVVGNLDETDEYR